MWIIFGFCSDLCGLLFGKTRVFRSSNGCRHNCRTFGQEFRFRRVLGIGHLRLTCQIWRLWHLGIAFSHFLSWVSQWHFYSLFLFVLVLISLYQSEIKFYLHTVFTFPPNKTWNRIKKIAFCNLHFQILKFVVIFIPNLTHFFVMFLP